MDISNELLPIRNCIIAHSLYNELNSIEDLQVFSQHHVFAVWDFMSLLKSLQRNLTCVANPWVPVGSANTRYLINEIVIGEESDIDEEGVRCSHFELYLKAMKSLGAPTGAIEQLLLLIGNGVAVKDAMNQLQLPQSVIDFCSFTFDVIENAPLHIQAAVFTHGREDLIPQMFHELVSRLSQKNPGQLKTFKYYLDRHIEVDSDHHSQLAIEMVEELCGNDVEKWEEVKLYSIKALEMRKRLWDGVYEKISVVA